LSFLEFALNWTKCQYFDKLHQFFWIVIVQIQTRHIRDRLGKENTSTLLMDWKIIMFNHEGVQIAKVMWSLWILFSQVKSKKLVTKKYKIKEPNMHNPNQFMASQNLLYNFFKWILNVIFSLRSNVFEARFQEPSTLGKVKIAMGTLALNLE